MTKTKPIEIQLSAFDRLAQARGDLRKSAPYFYSMVCNFVPVECPGLGTLGVTNHLVLIFDPDYVNKISREELLGVLIHEAQHIFRQTHQRLGDRKHEKFNIAADIPINDSIKEMGIPLPDGVLYHDIDIFKMPPNLAAEEYYELLTDEMIQKMHQPGVGSGQCGKCGSNPIDGGLEDSLDGEYGRTKAERDRTIRQTAEDMKAHKGRGNVPGGLMEIAEALLTPSEVPWQTILANLVRDAVGAIETGMDDYSMSKPNKRSFMNDQGIIRPGFIRYCPTVMIVADTSGSMGSGPASLISIALRESAAILNSLGIEECQFIDCDMEIAKSRKLSVNQLRKLETFGHGGTSFLAPFNEASKMNPKPDLMIYATDGQGEAPKNAPIGYSVIWLILGVGNKSPVEWGRKVKVIK